MLQQEQIVMKPENASTGTNNDETKACSSSIKIRTHQEDGKNEQRQ